MNGISFFLIKELKKRPSEFSTFVDLRIFGSRARGDCEVSSDMDVFIEVENLDRDTREKTFDDAEKECVISQRLWCA